MLGGLAQPLAGGWNVTAAAGLSVTQATEAVPGPCSPTILGCVPRAGTTERQCARVGVPVELGVHAPVRGAFGTGVHAFANANPGRSYGGLSFDLRFNPARASHR